MRRSTFDPRYLVLLAVLTLAICGVAYTSAEVKGPDERRESISGGAGLEGDLATRPNGDGQFLANDVVVIRQLVAGLATPQPGSNEFQRADTAPLATRGDGILNAADVVQVRRYVAGLDAPNPAGGPTPTPVSLTVLYDKLGGPGNWGFDTGNAYQTWFDSAGTDFRVVTQFVGALSSPVVLRRFEVAMRASSPTNPSVNIDLSNFTFKLKIWNASVGTFFGDALNPSLAGYTLGPINFGSTTLPVGTSVSGRPIFHIGWDNLEIPLPSNVPLEISLQASVNSATENVVNYGSIVAGPNMMTAIRIGATGQTNATIGQPMAAKLSVTP